MAKQAITELTTNLNNMQAYGDVAIGQGNLLKANMDKAGNDIKTYINDTLIPALNGNDGSKMIGHQSENIVANNINEAIEEIFAALQSSVQGQIPDGTISNAKLATDVKIGSLASLTTSEKSSVVAAINEVVTDVGIANQDADTAIDLAIYSGTVYNASGSTNAYAISRPFDGFDYTEANTGKIIHFNPNITNTGACTLNVTQDSVELGAKAIKKADSIGSFIDLESSDIKKNAPVQVMWNYANDFFVYAPKGGSNIKSIQHIGATILNANSSSTTPISSVNTSNSVLLATYRSLTQNNPLNSMATFSFTSSNMTATRSGTSDNVDYSATIIEYKNIKKIQRISTTMAAGSATFKDISIEEIDPLKSFVVIFTRSADPTNANYANYNTFFQLSSDNVRVFAKAITYTMVIEMQIVEFE